MKTITTILGVAFLASVSLPANAETFTVTNSGGSTSGRAATATKLPSTKRMGGGGGTKGAAPIADQAATGVLSKKKN